MFPKSKKLVLVLATFTPVTGTQRKATEITETGKTIKTIETIEAIEIAGTDMAKRARVVKI